MSPRKFRMKPVFVEAMQFNGLQDYVAIVTWMRESGYPSNYEMTYSDRMEPIMTFHSLRGQATVKAGDWILLSGESEFNPCGSRIFELTYEAVAVDTLSQKTQDFLDREDRRRRESIQPQGGFRP